jgi:multidrug efflux pump subunit AcrA (membrane-fusion protein)
VYVIGSNNSSQQVTVVSGQILSDNTVIVTGKLQAGQTVGLMSSTTSTSNNGGGFGGGGSRFIVP